MDAEETRGEALLERAYLERLSKRERDELLAAIVALAPIKMAGKGAEVIEETIAAARTLFGLIDTVELREAEAKRYRGALGAIAHAADGVAKDDGIPEHCKYWFGLIAGRARVALAATEPDGQ